MAKEKPFFIEGQYLDGGKGEFTIMFFAPTRKLREFLEANFPNGAEVMEALEDNAECMDHHEDEEDEEDLATDMANAEKEIREAAALADKKLRNQE
jgi:hypothetical protein